MTLINIEHGSVASSSVLNNNFTDLDDKITAANTAISGCTAYTDTKVASAKASLENTIDTEVGAVSSDLTDFETEVNGELSTINSEIDKLKRKDKPIMIPIVDWTTMQSLVTGSIKTTNSTTGIEYYAGSATAGTFKKGDIILKEDFTNYPQIMVVYSGASGQTSINSIIIDTWNLDNILTILPDAAVRTNILGSSSSANDAYWNIFGYNREESQTSAKTTKKYFYCNDSHNYAGIIEIYGLTNLTLDVYIIDGATATESGWLSDTDDEEAVAITPSVGILYTIKTAGTYYNKHYRWNGSNYIEVTDAIIPE